MNKFHRIVGYEYRWNRMEWNTDDGNTEEKEGKV
jgi:hypothetical protein